MSPPRCVRMHTPSHWLAVLIVLILGFALQAGCQSAVRSTDPPQTATEQFLLSTAASRAVDQISVNNLRGRKVFVDTTYFGASQQNFVVGELRAKLLLGGVELLPERDKAQIVLEVRSGGVGIDRSDTLVGIPSILLQADSSNQGSGARVPLATPELALLKNTDQRGIASVAYVAYWRETGEVVASSGPFVGWTYRDDWWYFGLIRATSGDIAPTSPRPE